MQATPQPNKALVIRIWVARWFRQPAGKESPVVPLDPRCWFRRVLGTLIGTLLGIGLLVYVVDPYQAYRKPTLYKPVYDEAYYSIPGIVRHYEYDSLLVGSSMCQNFQVSDLQKEFGGTWVKLTPLACRPVTARKVMELAFAEKPIRRVLIGLDIFGYGDNANQHWLPLPEYLYDKNPWNDYKYLWNKTVLRAVFDVIKSNVSQRPEYRYKLDADRMWGWDFEDGRREYGYQIVMTEEKARGAFYTRRLDKTIQNTMAENLKLNLLEVIWQHRNTEFLIFFPPYSVLAWYGVKYQGSDESLSVYLDFKRMALQKLLAEPNVRVFDFQTDREIVTNFDNYKDSTHYSPAINRLLLNRIRQDMQRVTPENLESGITGIVSIADEFASQNNEGKTP
jgi:hypothetical protein